ncbi:MAG: KpsF/GutQ family sugar-phosphate isomerase [Vicinamibacterales bacterium]|jgi:arabinose-5-phosphate isomerase|nr:KpsF/GutQ family sugar-phosphate isomerase [Vicinamibacterales bacterium]|tara:strand:- start:515 stop:1477 length:963 start_codon:yes stop_codon:yes gene_type:complete
MSADLTLARQVLETEAAAILALLDRIDGAFERAVDVLQRCSGRVIVTGMGKSGIICRKIAATLSSTGTPAFFLHPAEAIHGDLGVIQRGDAVVALSYSGETDELLRLLETIRRQDARLVAVTGAPASTLGQAADVTLNCRVNEEACPLNLVPTASTTAALALGDALAMALLVRKGFKQEDFASLHPGGKLGKRLMRVEHLMHSGDQLPCVEPTTPMRDVIYEMSSKGLGMTCVAGADRRLAGIITDGDLRRHMDGSTDVLTRAASDVMTAAPVTIAGSTLAVEALNAMEAKRITSLVVVDDGRIIRGVLQIHDLWRTELF